MVSDHQLRFLGAVLGGDGAAALSKAAERSAQLGDALVPRAILAWLGTARNAYDGSFPGVDDSKLSFTKTEKGYTGSLSIRNEMYRFSDASLFHVAAGMAVSLGMDPTTVMSGLRDVHIEKLGKSVDVLIKARSVNLEIEKQKEEGDLDKKDPAENSGPAHAPEAPKAAEPPTKVQPPTAPPKPKPSKPKLPKVAKPVASYTLKLSRAEVQRACPVCDRAQFSKGAFTGCLCMMGLAKAATVVSFDPDGVVLQLDAEEWDKEAIQTILEAVGRK